MPLCFHFHKSAYFPPTKFRCKNSVFTSLMSKTKIAVECVDFILTKTWKMLFFMRINLCHCVSSVGNRHQNQYISPTKFRCKIIVSANVFTFILLRKSLLRRPPLILDAAPPPPPRESPAEEDLGSWV